MITLFQRLADGELSLKSPRADPDADCGVGSGIGSGQAPTQGASAWAPPFPACLPPTAAGTGSPPRAPRRHGTASLRAYRPLRRNSGGATHRTMRRHRRTTCRSRHAGRRTRRALLPARHRRFRGIGEFGIGRKFVRPHQRQGGHGFAPIAFENGGPPGHAAYQRVSSGRAGIKRAVGIGGIQDAQDRLRRGGNGKLRGCPQPFPLGEKLRGRRCPDKREQQQAQNKKAGEAGSPGHLRDVFTPSVFTETNSRISTYALRYSLSSFPARKKGRRLGSTATFSPVRGLRPA